MGSKFENFDLGRMAAKFLGTKDQKNFPAEVHTQELLPVLCVGNLGYDLVEYSVDSIGNAANISSGYTFWPVGVQPNATTPQFSTRDFPVIIDDLYVRVHLSAGVTTIGYSLQVSRFAEEGSQNPWPIMWDLQDAGEATATTDFYFSMRGTRRTQQGDGCKNFSSRGIYVPQGKSIRVDVAPIGGNWPANPTVDWGMCVLHNNGKGMLRSPT